MNYNENFKCMLALTYYKQSGNMSKHSENTIWLVYETASNQDTTKECLVILNREQGQS